MMQKIKLILIGLIIFSLFSCTTAVSVHVPVGCLGQPHIDVKFTQKEADSIPLSVIEKFELISNTYKARINSQCSVNGKHDKLHETN